MKKLLSPTLFACSLLALAISCQPQKEVVTLAIGGVLYRQCLTLILIPRGVSFRTPRLKE